jgi:oligopeptidase B
MSISLVTFSLSAQQNQPENMSEEPKALKKQTVLMNHDHKRVDDYFWMNERDSKEVLDQLNAENAYSKSYFSSLENLQQTLLDEFK